MQKIPTVSKPLVFWTFFAASVLSLSGQPAPPQSLKPLVGGLLSMGTFDNQLADANSMPGVLSGEVINVTWRQLQPHSSDELDLTSIDSALARVRDYNMRYPDHPLKVILRVNSADDAPDWVKKLDGGPVPVLVRRNRPLEIPLFWTDHYLQAWRNLQNRLAAKYDSDPLIVQVSNTTCANLDDESYVTSHDSDSILALFKAGYSNQQFIDGLMRSIHDYDAWQHTRVDFTQNPFEVLAIKTGPDGKPHGVRQSLDTATTIRIMTAFRHELGLRAIISNHNLNSVIFKANRDLYPAMKALGKPIEFQTASAGVSRPDGTSTGLLKDWNGAMENGIGIGASAVELWPSSVFRGEPINDGWNPISTQKVPGSEYGGQKQEDLARWNAELKANL